MTQVQVPSVAGSLDDRMRSVAEAVRRELLALVEKVAGPNVRPTSLSRMLGIDKNLANRLVRAIRADDALDMLVLAPSPHGLRIFVDAVDRAADVPAQCEAARSAIEQVQLLNDEFPGGRAALVAAIGAERPGVRDRNEHAAKQAVYKAMSYLLGYQCDALVSASLLQPSQAGDSVDELNVVIRAGLRRLRPSTPIHVSGFRFYSSDDSIGPQPHLETIDGLRTSADALPYLLTDFCSDPMPKLKLVTSGDYTDMLLSATDPPLNESVTVAVARILRNGWLRYRSPDRDHEWQTTIQRFPCKTSIRDVYIRDDVFGDADPDVSVRLPSMKDPSLRPRDGEERGDELDMSIDIESLGTGGDVECSELPQLREVMRHVFERSGWDASRFRVYRTRVVYPPPMVSLTWWFRLPEPPNGG